MMKMINGIDISSFLAAGVKFNEYRQNLGTEQNKAGAIQAFEYTYEMSWKTMKRIMTKQGIVDINSPRQCFREAARIGLISDPKSWFYFIEIRNLTSHTYSDKNAEQVIDSFSRFSLLLNEFVLNLEKIK